MSLLIRGAPSVTKNDGFKLKMCRGLTCVGEAVVVAVSFFFGAEERGMQRDMLHRLVTSGGGEGCSDNELPETSLLPPTRAEAYV